MKKSVLIYFVIFLFSCQNQQTIVDKTKLSSMDYRLFQQTIVWTLAKSVMAEDKVKIEEEINNKKIPINFQEKKFGSTLLMIAIYNNKYESVKTLLKLGADPNLHDTYTGKTAVIVAAKNDDLKYLRLLLNYKGDPNSIENTFNKKIKNESTIIDSAITASISSNIEDNSFEKVKLLVEKGADINYFKRGYIQSPLAESLIQERMDIAEYLLRKGADYKKPIIISVTNNEKEVSVLYLLRASIIDLKSPQYQKKKRNC